VCLLFDGTISPHNNRRGKDVTPKEIRLRRSSLKTKEEKRGLSVLEMSETDSETNHEEEKDSEGRTRQFPHRAGNFATSVRIRCQTTTKEKRALSQIAREVQRHLLLDDKDNNNEGIKVREMSGEDHLHVSLSKVFPVRKEQREPYRSQLKASFNAFRISRGILDSSLSSSSCNSLLELTELRVFVNDERTTTFVAVCEKDPGDDATLKHSGSERVREMILAVNAVNERFGFPKYEYEPCVIPHVSFCYADGDWEEEMKRAVEAVVKKRKEEAKEDASVEITCKTDAVDLCISGWEPKKVFSSESLPPPPI